ncbi:MAG: creatininase family protein, partial [Rickettsiales bacterium]|nr:creatininase family protein [Rickettsiales bacterium]
TLICFLGDSGGNQSPQSRVAERLNKEWQTTEARVLQVGDYYHVSQAPVSQWLQAQGESTAAIGTHGGITDTSQLLAVNPKQVRPVEAVALAEDSGVIGDPRRANAAYGREILQRRIEAAVAQIRAAREAMNK